jgi:uncharacterized membrane protein
MGVSTHSIEVNAPLTAVCNQWTHFEEFPHFMDGVEEVRQEGGKRLFLESEDRRKGQRMGSINYRTSSGSQDCLGKYRRKPELRNHNVGHLGSDLTRVNAAIGYETEGLLEKTCDALVFPRHALKGT